MKTLAAWENAWPVSEITMQIVLSIRFYLKPHSLTELFESAHNWRAV
ncbi:hypothetical protein [Paraburkholderia sacchari]|nr:hypothetical protein [Paraburkholderia sacchari]